MRRLILRILEPFCNLAIIVIFIYFVMMGARTGGAGGAIVGAIVGLVVSVITFGALFLLMDIADNTRRTADDARNPFVDRRSESSQ